MTTDDDRPTASTLTAAATRAERIAAPGSCPPPAADEAEKLLAELRGQAPFDDQRWWDALLAQDAVSATEMAAVLAEDDDSLAARLGDPDWLKEISSLVASPETSVASSPERPFSVMVGPLVEQARAELRRRFAALPGHRRIDPDALLQQLFEPIETLVERVVQRTGVYELAAARTAGLLHGPTPESRFEHFVELLGSPGLRGEVLARRPVLARQVADVLRFSVAAASALARDLVDDVDSVCARFAPDGDPGRLVEVETGLGDRHRGAHTVASVRFESGLRVVYKPRRLSVDVHFQQLLTWVNGVSAFDFRTIDYLDRGDHGWAEWVVAGPCADAVALHRFYRRQGGLLALLHVLHAVDFHAENLIAAGDQPVLVDLESLCEPQLPFDVPETTSAERAVARATRGSVLGVGLLPSRMWVLQAGRGADLSGLSQDPGVPSPIAVPVLKDAGTDTMRIVLERVAMEGNDHRPVAADEELPLLRYAGDILDGFTEMYRLCGQHRDELHRRVECFADDEVRVIVRPTMWYGHVLHTGVHPALLGSGLDRDRYFDRLWTLVPQWTEVRACIPAERHDLWNADIPIFTALAGGTDLLDSRRQVVPGLTLRPGLERVRERIDALGPDDLLRQRWLIRASLGTVVIESAGQPQMPSYSPEPVLEALSTERLLAVADVLGQRLEKIGFVTDDSAQWLGLNTVQGETWSVGPLGPDLFHGLAGLALFLGRLGQVTGDVARVDLARKAFATMRQQIDHRGELDRTNGMAGLPGAIYATCQLAEILDDESLVPLARGWLERFAPHLREDTDFDVVAGAAGTILALQQLHVFDDTGRTAEVIRAAADHLLATARESSAGVGWLSSTIEATGQAQEPIAGFSHGAAGLAYALTIASRITGEGRYLEAALSAVRYEQALFNPERGLWLDRRNYAVLGVAEGAPPPTAWCYGAPGIGLSRLRMRGELRDDVVTAEEIETALTTTMRTGFGQSHALCHGDVGNAELFLEAAAVLGDDRWRAEARRRVSAVVASAKTQGWVCGTPLGVETPSLMVGLAGTGYGLLRTAAPDRVPSVLTLSPCR